MHSLRLLALNNVWYQHSQGVVVGLMGMDWSIGGCNQGLSH